MRLTWDSQLWHIGAGAWFRLERADRTPIAAISFGEFGLLDIALLLRRSGSIALTLFPRQLLARSIWCSTKPRGMPGRWGSIGLCLLSFSYYVPRNED